MIPLFDELDSKQKAAMDVLHEIDKWPVDVGKDAAMLKKLADLYPDVNLEEEALGYALWCEQKRTKRPNHRLGFRNWVKRAYEWKVVPGNRGSSERHRVPQTEEHGGDVRAVVDW